MKKTIFFIGLILAAVAAFSLRGGGGNAAHAALIQSAVVINFEDQAFGPLNSQYANLGITFNSPTVISYQNMPGFAHSGVKGIEQCFAAEFCNAPIDMSFTTGQRRVKVWVGYANPLNENRTVILRALDANGTQIGQATTILDPSAAARPVNTPLEITLPNPDIRRALVSFSPTDISPYSLVVDDVEFDTAGPAPACPATAIPIITVNQPTNNQVVQFNSFLLDTQVFTQDPLATTIGFRIIGPDGVTRSAANLPLSGGRFGPTLMNGGLVPGNNTVHLKFTDCRAIVRSSRTITYTPIPDGTKFEMLGIEITQAVQNAPLIANKPALARVYLRIQSPLGASATIKDVFGKLSARRYDAGVYSDYLPPGSIQSINIITVDTSDNLASKQTSLNATINFNLPAEWITADSLHLTFRPEIKGSLTSPSDIPCINCDNYFPGTFQPRLNTFHTTRKMNLILAPYIYQPSNNPPFPLSADLLFTPSGALQWVNNVYPLAGNFPGDSNGINLIRILPMQITTRNMQTSGGKDAFLSDIKFLYTILKSQGGLPSDTRVLAMVPCGCGGQADIGGHAAFADTWASEKGPVDSSKFHDYGNFWAHELGHTYGRLHAGNYHGEEDNGQYDEDFPYFHGGISVPGIALITEWWRPGGNPYLINPGSLSPLGQHAHDFMSYGHTDELNTGMWVSPYTYFKLADAFGFPGNNLLTSSLLVQKNENLALIRADEETTRSTEPIEKLVAVGQIKANGSVDLQPFFRSITSVNSISRADGEFSIELLDDQGRMLIQHRFDAKVISHSEDGALSFDEFIPWNKNTKRITIKRKDLVLAVREVSSHHPTIRILSPNDGELMGKETNINWEASDQDGDSLTYTILYNNGTDKTWWPVATNIKTTSISVDTSMWPGSKLGRIKVQVTDGVNTAEDVTKNTFTVPNKNPMVAIINLETDKDPKEEQHLMGFAYDPEDGFLSESNLTWISDRDGVVGKGRQVKLNGLSSGTHTITLTVTNSHGQTSTTQVKDIIRRPTSKKLFQNR